MVKKFFGRMSDSCHSNHLFISFLFSNYSIDDPQIQYRGKYHAQFEFRKTKLKKKKLWGSRDKKCSFDVLPKIPYPRNQFLNHLQNLNTRALTIIKELWSLFKIYLTRVYIKIEKHSFIFPFLFQSIHITNWYLFGFAREFIITDDKMLFRGIQGHISPECVSRCKKRCSSKLHV